MKQLSALDAGFVFSESATCPQHIGSLSIFDPSTAPTGELRYDQVVDLIAKRGHMVPYLRHHPVEMFYRDNRLNSIHEGTTCIQSLDLLARKVPMKNMAGYLALLAEMEKTVIQGREQNELAGYADELESAIATLKQTTETLLQSMVEQNIDLVLSNSVKYLELFGNVVIAWLWLKQGVVANRALADQPHDDDRKFYRGKLQALRYFFRFELPQINAWSKLLTDLDSTCYEMNPDWF